MHWPDLSLLVPSALALAAGAWFIVRWKLYGLIPAVVLGFLAFAAEPFCDLYLQEYLDPITFSKSPERVLVWLLASAATLVALTSLWAGYSRGYWFWRLGAVAGVPALLATIDAKEPILFCLATMPFIAGGAWLIRRRQDRPRELEEVRTGERRNRRARWRWSLRDALLMFIVVGLFAVAVRSPVAGEAYFVSWSFLVSSITFIAVSLAAAGAGVARQARWRWIFRLLTLVLAMGGWVVYPFLVCDALGLMHYFDVSYRGPTALLTLLAVGTAAMTTAVVLFSHLYAVVIYNKSLVWKRLAGGLLAVVALGLLTPLAVVYPMMVPVAANVTPLPPSVAYDNIQLAGQRAMGQWMPGFNAAPVVKELKAALAEPGNVRFSTRELRKNQLALTFDRSFQREMMLCSMLEVEAAKAEFTGPPSECLEIAILQWRLGRVLRSGGVYMDWYQGHQAETFGCRAVSHSAEKLSDDDCRRALAEVRRSLEDRPDAETVLAYDAYWKGAYFGWRDNLNRSARWLAGKQPSVINAWTDERQFRNLDTRGLLRLRLMEARLALELYRREHGQWPQELQDLVPDYLPVISADPYSTATLIYRRQDEGFLLYSVGPDGRDNGGRVSNNEIDMKLEGFDIDWNFDRRIQTKDWPRRKKE